MSAKRINPRRIKLHRSYTVEEAARTLEVHRNTVRGWRAKGLQAIDNRRPVLFDGGALRVFLEKQRGKRKCPCRPGTMYCFRCREPRAPALDMVDYAAINTISGNLEAICGSCGTVMHRRARLAALSAVMPGIEVHVAGAEARLNETTFPPLNCDSRPGG